MWKLETSVYPWPWDDHQMFAIEDINRSIFVLMNIRANLQKIVVIKIHLIRKFRATTAAAHQQKAKDERSTKTTRNRHHFNVRCEPKKRKILSHTHISRVIKNWFNSLQQLYINFALKIFGIFLKWCSWSLLIWSVWLIIPYCNSNLDRQLCNIPTFRSRHQSWWRWQCPVTFWILENGVGGISIFTMIKYLIKTDGAHQFNYSITFGLCI